MNPIKKHVQNWQHCKKCNLCNVRSRPVFYRGHSADKVQILFIGESPGVDDNASGIPFSGSSGEMLNYLINETKDYIVNNPSPTLEDEEIEDVPLFSYGITHSVACIPRDEASARVRAPKKLEIDACRERLLDIIRITSPLALVALGNVAYDMLKTKSFLNELNSEFVYDENGFDVQASFSCWDEVETDNGYLSQSNFPNQEQHILPIIKTKHPSFILREKRQGHLEQLISEFVTDVGEFWRKVWISHIPF